MQVQCVLGSRAEGAVPTGRGGQGTRHCAHPGPGPASLWDSGRVLLLSIKREECGLDEVGGPFRPGADCGFYRWALAPQRPTGSSSS